jgi:hypothetical protein
MGISEWLPMPPQEGPPLPKLLRVFWPWNKIRTGPLPYTPGPVYANPTSQAESDANYNASKGWVDY